MENLVDEKHNEFVEKFRAAGSRALQYAWERNACNILIEAEERRRIAPNSCEPMSVVIAVNVLYRGRTQASVQVDKLSFKRTLKFCDKDFPEEEVDLDQLEFDFTRKDRPEADDVRDDAVEIEPPKVRAVLDAANRLKCKAIFPCRQGTAPNWERSVRVVSGDESRIVLLPEGQERELMDSLADCGDLVVDWDGKLHPSSIEKLLLNGYDVRCFNAVTGNNIGSYEIDDNAESPDFGKVKFSSANRVGIGVEDFLNQGNSIVANVLDAI